MVGISCVNLYKHNIHTYGIASAPGRYMRWHLDIACYGEFPGLMLKDTCPENTYPHDTQEGVP